MKKIKIWHIILTLIICPLIVGIILKYLPSTDKHDTNKTSGDYSHGVVEGDYKTGDQIDGTKIEGDNNTVIINPEQRNEEKIQKYSYEISQLQEGDRAKYVRVIKIRNNSNSTIHNFHFSIRCDKPIIKASDMPFVEGGIFTINYDRTIDTTYEAEVEPLRPNKSVIVPLGANEPFEVENVKVYNE